MPPRNFNFTVARGPVPRRAKRTIQRSRGTGPRATVKKTPPLHVGRGPVPRRAQTLEKTGVRERQKKTPRITVGRGPVPRYAKRTIQRSRGKPARMRVWHPRAPALRKKRFSSLQVRRTLMSIAREAAKCSKVL